MANNAPLRLDYSWTRVDGVLGLVAYRDGGTELVWELIDYAAFRVVKEGLDDSTVKNDLSLLKAAFEFLGSCRKIESIDDSWIKEFREFELERIMRSKNSRKDIWTAKRTVNEKLRRLYTYLIWNQKNVGAASNLIGEKNCQVYIRPRSGRSRSIGFFFPLLYARVGSGGEFRSGKAATVNDASRLDDYFLKSGMEFTALRNILFRQIADFTGMRRASINSLTIGQFPVEEILIISGYLRIRPSVQKFSYQNEVKIPAELAVKIATFIAGSRARFLSERGWGEDRTGEYLFFSARNGRPLTNQAWSTIFGKGRKQLGLPLGHGIHAFRFKNAIDRIDAEHRSRTELGLDTSIASIAAAVAFDLGQKNVDSIKTYVQDSYSKIHERHRALIISKNDDPISK